MSFGPFIQQAFELQKNKIPFVSVTLVWEKGHVPQDVGAKAIITKDGLVFGTVGGGRLEARAIEYSLHLLKEMDAAQKPLPPAWVRYDLKKDFEMVCGGSAALFYEPFSSYRWTIVLFGAGHVAQACVPLLCTLDAHVICIDDRKEWLDRLPEHPHLEKKLSSNMSAAVYELPTWAYYLLMTKGYVTDLPIMESVLKHAPRSPYIGMIGSRPKMQTMREELTKKNFAGTLIDQIICPVGLQIGSNRPSEIAISIAAQLIAVRESFVLE